MHWSDDTDTVAALLVRARQAVAARVGLEDAATAQDVMKAFQHAGEAPCVPEIGRMRAAVDAIGIRHPRLAADLRPMIERCYVLDLLARG
jgi:hypothetical protein